MKSSPGKPGSYTSGIQSNIAERTMLTPWTEEELEILAKFQDDENMFEFEAAMKHTIGIKRDDVAVRKFANEIDEYGIADPDVDDMILKSFSSKNLGGKQMQNVISFEGYRDTKQKEAEPEKGCDLFAVLDHITGKAQNDRAVEEFKEMIEYKNKNKAVRDEIRKRLFPNI